MGFDTQDLLKQAKYTEGDVLPLATFTPPSGRRATITSSTFTVSFDLGDFRIPFGLYVPDVDDLKVAAFAQINPGDGEEMDIRYRNTTSNQTVVEVTNITELTRVNTGFVDYNPENPQVADTVRYQHRTNPGTNTSQSNAPALVLGVEL